MKRHKGMEVTFQGSSDLKDFAKSVLMLTNVKSSREGIYDIQTLEGTNKIVVIMREEMYYINAKHFEDLIGEIQLATEVTLILIEEDDTEEITEAVDGDNVFITVKDARP